MNTSQIEIQARRISDSRGDATVEVEVRLGGVSAIGRAPAGKTKGGDEARTAPVDAAIASVREVIEPLARRAKVDLASHAGLIALERALIERAGPNCRDLGANALLPVSIGLWRTAATLQGLELYLGAFGIKTGAPQPEADFPDPSTWVRRRKYLRLCAIEAREAILSA